MAELNKDAFRVLKGFSNLDYASRVNLLELLKNYQEETVEKRAAFMESFAAKAGLPLGPTGSGGCPCCGK